LIISEIQPFAPCYLVFTSYTAIVETRNTKRKGKTMTTSTTKADRVNINRAPKGGGVSTVNGQFYAGGQFMPMVAVVVEVKPAPLAGSTRQVAWANRLRAAALKNLNDEIAVRVAFLNEGHVESRAIRATLKRLMVTRHNLMTERSAAAVIDRRAMLV
jgi:hypothetical protein